MRKAQDKISGVRQKALQTMGESIKKEKKIHTAKEILKFIHTERRKREKAIERAVKDKS